MPELYVDGSVTPGRLTKDHSWLGARGLRDGSLVTANYLDALAQEGRVFTANMGSVTTPLTFLVTAANRPDAWIRVPANTAILPIKVVVSLEAMTGTATELDVRMASNDIGNGTSSAASVGPLSVRSDNPITSACTARQLATADTTAETTPMTLYRREFIRADDAGSDSKGIEVTREMMGFPVLVGAASWEVFVAATTNQATGFVVMTYAEVPSSMFV
jgi:hypothetical protein